ARRRTGTVREGQRHRYPPENLERVFEMFTQSAARSAPRRLGVGEVLADEPLLVAITGWYKPKTGGARAPPVSPVDQAGTRNRRPSA
ncbi:MAG: hypothetical protein ACXW12_18180, partial [Burkholderiales bacterium]